MDKIYGNSPVLGCALRGLFATHPCKAAILSLYMLPVRNAFKIAFTQEHTFSVSKEYYDELHSLLHIAKAEGHELMRTGDENDGGYVMLDDLPGGIAYSFGIARNVSWDRDMASRGYDVYMYDHTIDSLPEENVRFHWSKLGIGDGSGNDVLLKTLEELIAVNGHEGKSDMILKMDVEGAEWGFLESVKPETLLRFRQILFEFHGLMDPKKYGLSVKYSRILEMLEKVNASHQLIHLHPCNFSNCASFGGKIFPQTVEATYVIRDKYKFEQDYDVELPLEIDAPDRRGVPDIDLGRWNRDVSHDAETITSIVRVM